jgi:tetratricopeptide (TPR) repeat protein
VNNKGLLAAVGVFLFVVWSGSALSADSGPDSSAKANPLREEIQKIVSAEEQATGGKAGGAGQGTDTAFWLACDALAKPTGKELVTDRELADIANSLQEVAKRGAAGDEILGGFIREKTEEIKKAAAQKAESGGSDYELMRALEHQFGPDMTLEGAVRLCYMSELAMRYRAAGRPARELALIWTMRDLSSNDRRTQFCLTHDMVRAALAMGNVALAVDIACEYFARFRCAPLDEEWDCVLFTTIGRKAAQNGDSPTAFQCARMAWLMRPGHGRSDALLSEAFACLGPSLWPLFAETWPSKQEKGDKWFDEVAKLWAARTPLAASPAISRFEEDCLKRAIEAKRDRTSVARMQMLLGREKAAIEALVPADGQGLSSDDWYSLCRVLLLTSGDPRILEPGNSQVGKLKLDPAVSQRLLTLIEQNHSRDDYAGSLKEQFVAAGLSGSLTSFEDIAGKAPKGHVLALFFDYARKAVEAGNTADAVTALKAMSMLTAPAGGTAPAGQAAATPAAVRDVRLQEKREILAWFLVRVPDTSNPEAVVDEMMATFPEGAPREKAREFLRYAQLYDKGKHLAQFKFHAPYYLYRQGEYADAVTALDQYDVEEARKHLLKGLCYLKMDDTEKAKAELKVVLQKFPDAPQVEQALFVIGWCDMISGKRKEAAETFGKLVEKYPKGEYAEKARKLLENLKGGQ